VTRRRAASSAWQALLLAGVYTLTGGVLLGAWAWTGVNQLPNGQTSAVADTGTPPRQQRLRAVTPRPASLIPLRLKIPAIDVATPLVSLGLMPDRTVEVPSNADLAGWFRRGPAPGRKGSAVILGHVDSQVGPAVFARLQELRTGDTVTVDRADGSTVRFVVLGSVLYGNADFPADLVYAAQGARRLNLVTCGGTYDSTRGGYQSNLVVYTRRAQP